MLRSLDFLYTPCDDVDAAIEQCVENLGGELVWRIDAVGTLVAAVRMAAAGAAAALRRATSSRPRRSRSTASTRSPTRSSACARAGRWQIREVEIPPGPCATFTLAGARLGVYELTRPQAGEQLAQRT